MTRELPETHWVSGQAANPDLVAHRSDDVVHFAAALRLIHRRFPSAVGVTFETSDQSLGYGFWISDVTDSGHRSLWKPLTDEERCLVMDVVEAHLDLDWGGAVGEDKYGHATWRLIG